VSKVDSERFQFIRLVPCDSLYVLPWAEHSGLDRNDPASGTISNIVFSYKLFILDSNWFVLLFTSLDGAYPKPL
jgi:hypothetical protein